MCIHGVRTCNFALQITVSIVTHFIHTMIYIKLFTHCSL